jgi:hypothetical protein
MPSTRNAQQKSRKKRKTRGARIVCVENRKFGMYHEENSVENTKRRRMPLPQAQKLLSLRKLRQVASRRAHSVPNANSWERKNAISKLLWARAGANALYGKINSPAALQPGAHRQLPWSTSRPVPPACKRPGVWGSAQG